MPFLLAAEESSGGLIDVVPGLMIWTLICFAITFFALKKLAFSRIQQGIDSRRDRIRAAIDEADKAREEARELLEQHRQLIADAKGEAAGILADARKVADAQIERVSARCYTKEGGACETTAPVKKPERIAGLKPARGRGKGAAPRPRWRSATRTGAWVRGSPSDRPPS